MTTTVSCAPIAPPAGWMNPNTLKVLSSNTSHKYSTVSPLETAFNKIWFYET